MATSFKKRSASRPQHPRGSRPSLHNAQLLVSSGVPSMDALLGGGIAVGTVLLVEEDALASYSRLLLKFFLSEGVLCGHSVFLASASEDPATLLKDLPEAVGEDSTTLPSSAATGSSITAPRHGPGQSDMDQMQIAWRYQNLPEVQSSFSNRFGHFFDLTTSMDPSKLAAVDTVTFDASQQEAQSCGDLYSLLKTEIQTTIQRGHFSVDTPTVQQRNVLRIALQSLGSPLWLDEGAADTSTHTPSPSPSPTLPQFLHTLRAILRRAYAVAMVTVPTHLMQDDVFVHRLERLCDAVVRIESFAGSEKEQNPLYKDYHGLFHLVRLPHLNSLSCHYPETLDLAFKLRRKRFSIDKLHLPPELSETVSRTQEDGVPDKWKGAPAIALAPTTHTTHTAHTASSKEGREKLSKHNIDF